MAARFNWTVTLCALPAANINNMERISEIGHYEHSATAWLARLRPTGLVMYTTILLLLSTAIISLPFLTVDITVRLTGIVRPALANAVVRTGTSGNIAAIYKKEGDYVVRGTVILRVADGEMALRKARNRSEKEQRVQFIHDLELLTGVRNFSDQVYQQLYAPLYKEQYSRFRHRLAMQETVIQKLSAAIARHEPLAKEKIMAPQTLLDMQLQWKEVQLAYQVLIQEQLSSWQQELALYKRELAQYLQEEGWIEEREKAVLVKAPVSGFIQELRLQYPGSFTEAGEVVCIISPEDTLIAESYVPAKEIGLIRQAQEVVYRFDAYDSRYFGTLNGRVLAIDHDYTMVNNKPVFRVRSSFHTGYLQSKKRHRVSISKGLGFQARFRVAERNLWQLLTDQLDDWLNPTTPRS